MQAKNKENDATVLQLLFLLFTVSTAKQTIAAAGLMLFLFTSLGAQNVLTLEQAKAATLENNYGIKIAANNVLIAENNTDPRANGYLPTVNATGQVTSSLGGSTQTFNSGMENVVSNAFTWGANAGINANYTVLDRRRDLTLEQLKQNVDLTSLQLQQEIEQNLLQIYSAYYQVAQAAENIEVLENTIDISRERLQRADYGLEYGQGSGLDVLNARVDIQRDSVNLINARQQLINAKRNLNVLIGRNTTEVFQVDTTVVYNSDLDYAVLAAAARENNVTLRANRKSLEVNAVTLDIIDAEKKPVVTAGLGYTYNYSDNAAEAFITSSSSRGLGANVGVAWNIFDGGSRNIREQNTRLNLTNQKLQITRLEQQTERDLLNLWEGYQNALFILEVEAQAVATNRENFERTREQLNIGRLTSLEFRQAQLNLLNAQVNLNRAKYDAKVRELEVLQLAGQLP